MSELAAEPELTDGDLVTAVARYLPHHEALDVRVPAEHPGVLRVSARLR